MKDRIDSFLIELKKGYCELQVTIPSKQIEIVGGVVKLL